MDSVTNTNFYTLPLKCLKYIILLCFSDIENLPQWEKELQQELQDYEMVNDGLDDEDEDIENEILQEIEQESKTMWLYIYIL